jgi:hypothetical protein
MTRTMRHSGSTGKTLLPRLQVGQEVNFGVIIQLRKKRTKYPKNYLIAIIGLDDARWFRRDQFTLGRTEHAEHA